MFSHECRFRRRDRTRFRLVQNARAIHDQNGKVSHYQVFCKDIIERKQAEAVMRKGGGIL